MDAEIPVGTDRYRHFPGGEAEYWLRFARGVLERAFDGPLAPEVAAQAVPKIRQAFLEPAAWQVFPDVRPALDRLVSEGVRLAVVSNWDSNLPRVLDMLELTPYFETVVISHVEGIEKPNPGLFRRALDRLAVTAEQVLHIGDVPELDLAGAEAAGIDGLLVDRQRRLDGGLPRVEDFSDLPRIARSGTKV
jgi:HAD superfamily hydrolase (TIGR01549 family)